VSSYHRHSLHHGAMHQRCK